MKTLEQLKEEALKLVCLNAEDQIGPQDLYEASSRIYSDCIEIGSKYKKKEKVFVFEDGYHEICEAEVINISRRANGRFFYRLSETTGRNVGNGWIPEEQVFATKEELLEYYRKRLGL